MNNPSSRLRTVGIEIPALQIMFLNVCRTGILLGEWRHLQGGQFCQNDFASIVLESKLFPFRVFFFLQKVAEW